MYQYKPRRIFTNAKGIKGRTQLVYSLGLQHLFEHVDIGENNAIKICAEVIKVKIETNTYPSYGSKNKNIRKLAQWLSNMRTAKQGKGNSKFYPVLEQMATEAGFPDMFNITDTEIVACERCQQLINFINDHGRNPSKESQNIDEKKLGIWLSNMRKAKKDGQNGSKFYTVLEQMAIDAGFHNLFDTTDLETIACEICQQLINFINEHGKNPGRNSKNKDERKLAQWLDDMRKAKKGNCSRVFYDSVEWMTRDAGFPNIFNNIDKEQNAIDMCNKVIEFVNEHGHYPTYRYSSNEYNIGKWLSNMRNNNRHKTILYPVLYQMVKKAKLPNMFNSNWKDDLK